MKFPPRETLGVSIGRLQLESNLSRLLPSPEGTLQAPLWEGYGYKLESLNSIEERNKNKCTILARCFVSRHKKTQSFQP